MGEEKTHAIVLEFFKKKGFANALKLIEKDIPLPSDIMDIVNEAPRLTKDIHLGDMSKRIPTSFQTLFNWVSNSLDLYKHEFEKALFPIFVHCYLELIRAMRDPNAPEPKIFFDKYEKFFPQNSNELVNFRTITNQQKLKENEYASKFLKGKFQIEISQIAYELLTKFFGDSEDASLMSIVNQYLDFKVVKRHPFHLINNSHNRLDDEEGVDEDDEKNMSVNKVAWEMKTVHVPTRRGRKKKVDSSLVQKTIPPSICMYTMFNAEVNTIDFAPTNERPLFAGGMQDGSIKVWQNENYEDLLGHFGPVYGVNFSSDRKWLISGSEDGTARLWNLDTKSNVVVYKGHQFPIWDVNFSKIDYLFATASHDRTARIWSTDRVTPLRVLVGHTSDVDVVKFHPNSNYLATGSSDKTVRLWDVNSGECVRVFQGHYNSIHSLTFSNDGRYLASGGADHEIFVWDIATQKMVNHLHGHTDTIWSLSFNDDGSLLASGSHDNSVKIWNMQDAQSTYYTKQTPVYHVNFQRNTIVAAGPFHK
jgi:transcription initiation factor TFIID subunit 5